MTKVPITQRDSWSLLPNGKPKNEPTPNAFSAESFPKEDNLPAHELPEDPKEILDGYYTLIIFVTSGMIIGAILATITMLAIY